MKRHFGVRILTLGAAAILLLSFRGAAQSIKPEHEHRSHTLSRPDLTGQATEKRIEAFKFVSLDVPNSTFTLAIGIGPRGEIVGIYGDASFNEHGFLLKNGTFTTIDVPGALVGVSGTLQTEANGINGDGDIVGDYFAPPGAPGAPECTADAPPPACRRGFLLRDGRFSDVLVPGKKGSIPNSITSDGAIYGCDHSDDYFTSMVGFVRTPNGAYHTLDSGGGELENSAPSVLGSMNNGATPNGKIVVGLYVDPPMPGGLYHGYVIENRSFTPYDVPGSTLTQIWGINSSATFVGLYDDANGNEHGFLQRWGESTPVTIDVPASAPFNSILTDAFGINRRGHIVGAYLDSNSNTHGFLAVPVDPD